MAKRRRRKGKITLPLITTRAVEAPPPIPSLLSGMRPAPALLDRRKASPPPDYATFASPRSSAISKPSTGKKSKVSRDLYVGFPSPTHIDVRQAGSSVPPPDRVVRAPGTAVASMAAVWAALIEDPEFQELSRADQERQVIQRVELGSRPLSIPEALIQRATAILSEGIDALLGSRKPRRLVRP